MSNPTKDTPQQLQPVFFNQQYAPGFSMAAQRQPITIPASVSRPAPKRAAPKRVISDPQYMYSARGPLAAPVGYADFVDNYNTARSKAAAERLAAARAKMAQPDYHAPEKSKVKLVPTQSIPLYKQLRYPGDKLVHVGRNKVGHPLTRAERVARNDKSQLMNQVYSQFEAPIDKEAAYKQGRLAYLAATGHARPELTKDQKDFASARRKDKIAFHAYYPQAIYAPKPNEEFDSEQTQSYYKALRSGLGQFRGTADYVAENKWAADDGAIDDDDRAAAATAFAEATGVVGFMPTYDPRLTTARSAAQVYPREDYIFEFKDMDNNAATPGNLLIYEMKRDKKGNVVLDPSTNQPQKGRMVAANGYRLSKPNESQQIRRLKQMDYYYSNPTVEARKERKFADFVKGKNYLKARKPTGYRQIIDFISGLFSADLDLNAVRPNKLFAIMPVEGAQVPTLDIYAELNTIGWNTLLARVARLYLELNMFPLSQDVAAPTLEGQIWNEYKQHIQQFLASTPGVANSINPTDEQRTFMREHMMHPDLEKALINTRQDEIERILYSINMHLSRRESSSSSSSSSSSVSPAREIEMQYVLHLMDLAIKELMNCNMPTIADVLKNSQAVIPLISQFAQTTNTNDFETAAFNWFFLNYRFVPNCHKFFGENAEINFQRYADSLLPLVAITPAQPKLIKALTKYWGEQYVDTTAGPDSVPVDETYGQLAAYADDDDYEGDVPAYTETEMVAPTSSSSSTTTTTTSSSAPAAAAAQPQHFQ